MKSELTCTAEEKLGEASRWRDRMVLEMMTFQACTVRMRTCTALRRRVAHPWHSDWVALTKMVDAMHDRRLHSAENMRTSATCAEASAHAARVLFEEEEKQWT